MSLTSLLVLLCVGLVAGLLAQFIMGRRKRGLLAPMLVGVLGAFLGSWLLGLLGVSILGGLPGQIVQATIGAVVLLALLGALRR